MPRLGVMVLPGRSRAVAVVLVVGRGCVVVVLAEVMSPGTTHLVGVDDLTIASQFLPGVVDDLPVGLPLHRRDDVAGMDALGSSESSCALTLCINPHSTACRAKPPGDAGIVEGSPDDL